MNNTIKYLSIICDQNARIEVLTSAQKLPNSILEKVNYALSLSAHLLDELEHPQYNSVYFERQLADLVKRVDIIIASAPTIIHHRSCIAKITTCNDGYNCYIMDRLGNDVEWILYATTISEAIIEVERHFDKAIAYFRGFTTIGEFYKRIGVN